MATLTIDGVSTELKRKLFALAVENGSTVSQEALRIMAEALQVPATDPVEEPLSSETTGPQTGAQFYARVREAVAKYGGIDIELPPRTPSHREPPDFSGDDYKAYD